MAGIDVLTSKTKVECSTLRFNDFRHIYGLHSLHYSAANLPLPISSLPACMRFLIQTTTL